MKQLLNKKEKISIAIQARTKRRKEQIKLILKNLRNDCTVKEAVKAAGMSQARFYQLMIEKEKFAIQVTKARDYVGREVAESSLLKQVKKGIPVSTIFYLCNRNPDRWHNVNRVEHTGADGLPLKISVVDYSRVMDAQVVGTQTVSAFEENLKKLSE